MTARVAFATGCPRASCRMDVILRVGASATLGDVRRGVTSRVLGM